MRLPLLGEISFSPQGKGAPSEHTTTHCSTTPYRTPYKEGKVTSTGHSSDQYWSQREAVVVDICYQYWSLRRPVLVRIPFSSVLSWQPFAIAISMIGATCTTTLLQGNKSTYIGRRADLYCSDDEAI